MEDVKKHQVKITYEKLFWLFVIGSFVGVIIEGSFCLIAKGHWESHVLTLVGQFNALYGAGAVLFYSIIALLHNKKTITKVVVITIVATILEYLCGVLLSDVLGMKAWDYSSSFLNYRGIICLNFTLGWGAAGLVFCIFFNRINRFLSKLQSKKWNVACIVLSVFMAVNLSLTAASIYRWSERHYGVAANTKIDVIIDNLTPDEWMQKRFVDWSFLENDADKKPNKQIQKGEAKLQNEINSTF